MSLSTKISQCPCLYQWRSVDSVIAKSCKEEGKIFPYVSTMALDTADNVITQNWTRTNPGIDKLDIVICNGTSRERFLVTLKDTNNETIKLQSCDGKNFEMDVKKLTRFSRRVQTELNNTDMREKEFVFPVQHASGEVLQKIGDWIDRHHQSVEMRKGGNAKSSGWGRECGIGDWYSDFFNIPKDILLDLIFAAGRLEIDQLMNMACDRLDK